LIFTVGHSTRPIDELLTILREAGVRTLVDVRRFPGSRRHPQFGKEALREALAEAGIAYRHEPDLGGRREPRPDSPNTAWRIAAFRGYADHMASPAFQAALERLVAEKDGSPAILCAEAVPWKCHRQLVADALVARGVAVTHLMAPGQTKAHVLNAAAVVGPGGEIVYPLGGGASLFTARS
jgi:uncharacterized protein (DUF488 family)